MEQRLFAWTAEAIRRQIRFEAKEALSLLILAGPASVYEGVNYRKQVTELQFYLLPQLIEQEKEVFQLVCRLLDQFNEYRRHQLDPADLLVLLQLVKLLEQTLETKEAWSSLWRKINRRLNAPRTLSTIECGPYITGQHLRKSLARIDVFAFWEDIQTKIAQD